MANRAALAFALFLFAAPAALAQQDRDCLRVLGPVHRQPDVQQPANRYSELEAEHQLSGLASYYSTFFNGRKTANGEIFHNRLFSAAHLTLPMGCWIEVTARATGRKLRMRVNDRGPFAKKFMLDLSQAAARFLGVDVAPDRYVDVHVIALPGEEPPMEAIQTMASAATPSEQ
jgi:rare lipoprotein A